MNTAKYSVTIVALSVAAAAYWSQSRGKADERAACGGKAHKSFIGEKSDRVDVGARQPLPVEWPFAVEKLRVEIWPEKAGDAGLTIGGIAERVRWQAMGDQWSVAKDLGDMAMLTPSGDLVRLRDVADVTVMIVRAAQTGRAEPASRMARISVKIKDSSAARRVRSDDVRKAIAAIPTGKGYTLSALRAIPVRRTDGTTVPLSEVATVDIIVRGKTITECDKAISLNPKDARAYFNRGVAYAKNGELDKGIADCTAAIRLNREKTPLFQSAIYMARSRLYERKGEKSRAEEDFARARKLVREKGNIL